MENGPKQRLTIWIENMLFLPMLGLQQAGDHLGLVPPEQPWARPGQSQRIYKTVTHMVLQRTEKSPMKHICRSASARCTGSWEIWPPQKTNLAQFWQYRVNLLTLVVSGIINTGELDLQHLWWVVLVTLVVRGLSDCGEWWVYLLGD